MKRIGTIIAAALVAFGLQAQTVDVSKSSIYWKGEKVTGFHEGNISLKSAEFAEKDGRIASGTFVVDMGSMTCTDLTDETYNAKLIGHLKSDDFFGTENHPTATLTVKHASAFADGKAKVRGELTIKGKTNPVEFDVVKSGGTYTAELTVDRTKYDVKYGSGSFFEGLGDKMIYDNFFLKISIAVK